MSDTVDGHKISLDSQLERLEQILKENPNDPSSWMAFGEMSLRRGRRLVALLAFQRVASMKPEVLEVHLALAKIYGSQKMYAEAYNELLLSLKLEKGSVEARVLFDILIHEAKPPEELIPQFRNFFAFPCKPEELNLYLQQLNIEKDRLASDVAELTALLESSPMDTILEYNKNMAARRLGVIEELLEKTKHLEAIKFDEPSQGERAMIDEVTPVSADEGEKELTDVAAEETVEPPEPDMGQILQSLREALDPIMQNFKKTKGISAVVAFHLGGEIVHVLQDEAADLGEIARVLAESVAALLAFSADLTYWVIEFPKGVVVVQAVAPKLFLCAVGDPTTSFGSLRFLMDKNRPLFQEALKPINLSPLR